MAISSTSSSRKKPAKTVPSLLFHASSDDTDMHYFSRFHSSDPYLAFSHGKRRYGLAVPMEYSRMESESAFDEILLLSEVREAGIKITIPNGGPFLPERLIKTSDEVEALRKGNVASAAGLKAVADTLAESTIRKGTVYHGGRPLTSEKLRDIIGMATMAKGAVAIGTIAAAGDQACDCHNAGSGPIPAHQLIVCDIFPRRVDDGYWGDMTRTFLKGKASDAQRHLVQTVKRGHEIGIKLVKPGVTGGKIQKAVEDHFAAQGYKTVRNSRTPEGFFHAIGHGIGLDVHEGPVVRQNSTQKLKKGMVITIEPGLYYRGLGGCRIEDVVHVTADGGEKISSAPYRWEIA